MALGEAFAAAAAFALLVTLGAGVFTGEAALFVVFAAFSAVVVFGVEGFVALRVVFPLGLAGTTSAGEACFTGEILPFDLDPTRLVFFAGVAGFFPLLVVFLFGVATAGLAASSSSGPFAATFPLVTFGLDSGFGEVAFLPFLVVLPLGVTPTFGDASFSGEGDLDFVLLLPFLAATRRGVVSFAGLIAFFVGDGVVFGVDAFLPLLTVPTFGVAVFFAGLAAFFGGEGDFAFGAPLLPCRAGIAETAETSVSSTGPSSFPFFAGDTDLPRLPLVAFGAAAFDGVAGPCVGADFPLPFFTRPTFFTLAGVTDGGEEAGFTGLAFGDLVSTGVAGFGFPRVDLPLGFGVATFFTGEADLTGEAALARPRVALASLGVCLGEAAVGDTAAFALPFLPRVARPFDVVALIGVPTTFFCRVARPFLGDGLGETAGAGGESAVSEDGLGKTATFFLAPRPFGVAALFGEGFGDTAFGEAVGGDVAFGDAAGLLVGLDGAFLLAGVFPFRVGVLAFAGVGVFAFLGVGVFAFGEAAFGVVSSCFTPSTVGEAAVFGVFRSSLIPVSLGDFAAFGVFINSFTPTVFGDLPPLGLFSSLFTPPTTGDLAIFGVFTSSRSPVSLGDLGDPFFLGDASILFTPVSPKLLRDFALLDADRGETNISPGPSGVGGSSE